jgi:hypothetical protein
MVDVDVVSAVSDAGRWLPAATLVQCSSSAVRYPLVELYFFAPVKRKTQNYDF